MNLFSVTVGIIRPDKDITCSRKIFLENFVSSCWVQMFKISLFRDGKFVSALGAFENCDCIFNVNPEYSLAYLVGLEWYAARGSNIAKCLTEIK